MKCVTNVHRSLVLSKESVGAAFSAPLSGYSTVATTAVPKEGTVTSITTVEIPDFQIARCGGLSGQIHQPPPSGDFLLQLELAGEEYLPPAHIVSKCAYLQTGVALVLVVEGAPELVGHAQLAEVSVDL